MELKGEIPWSAALHAEASLRGHFKVHVPGRTYYLEDAAGDQATAELWVRTICDAQASAAASDGATQATTARQVLPLLSQDSFDD